MAIKEIDFFEGLITDALAQAAYPGTIESAVVETLDSSQDWVCPVGVYSVQVECYGGGGAGAGYVAYTGKYPASGGGGAYAKKTITVVPGNTYSVSIGAGGVRSTTGNQIGTGGGDTYFSSNSTVLAKGGGAGQNPGAGTAGSAASSIGDVCNDGYAGYEFDHTGKPGGNGASPAGGTGVQGGVGNVPGAGGGQGGENQVGFNGASGRVILTYYPTYIRAFAEASIINQGAQSLKAVALITNSLNKSLTRTLSTIINLFGQQTLKFDIRSNRTGSNIKIGLKDSGGSVTEITPNISSANAWQTVTWDISGVTNANKNAICQIIITIVNADAETTFYLDNFYGDYTAPTSSTADLNIEWRDKDGVLKGYLTPFVTAVSWEWNRFGGCGNCSITINKAYDSYTFSAMDDIQIRVKKSSTESDLVYRGFIESYSPTMKVDQEIKLEVRGYFDSLKKLIVHDTGDTKTYTTTEISLIVKDIIDTFVTPNSFITSNIYDIEAGEFEVDSIKFLTSVDEALKTLADLAGDIEYGVDEDLAFYWKQESDTINHKFIIGNNVKNYERQVNFGELVNKYYLVGGDPGDGSKFKRTAEDATSQSDYFLSEQIVNNGSISTNDVADQYLGALLDQNAEPVISITADIVNTDKRIEDNIPLGRVKFSDPDIEDPEENIIDNYDKLNCHFDGADGATSYDAETGQTATFVGTAQLDTAQKKFGDSSLLLDGDSDYITFPDSDNWNFGTGDFTVDFWIRWNNFTGNQGIICQLVDDNNSFRIWKNSSHDLVMSCIVGGVVKGNMHVNYATWNPQANTWYHLAFVRHGSSGYIFINGVAQSLDVDTAFGTNDLSNFAIALEIGHYLYSGNHRYLNGWIDEIRISKGIARWISDFTPPTKAYIEASKSITTHQISRISYGLSNTPGRFNITIETGSTKYETAARIKRLEMAMNAEQQN